MFLLNDNDLTDRELLSSDIIELTLRAIDNGGLFSETVVLVTVVDINDNAPTFQKTRISNLILECVQPGHVAAHVNASDPDEGLNGKVTYRIRSGSYDKFTINPKSGDVGFVKPCINYIMHELLSCLLKL